MNTENFYVDIELQGGANCDGSGLAVLSRDFFGDRKILHVGYSILSFLEGVREIYYFVSRYRAQILCVESCRRDMTDKTYSFPAFLAGMVGLWQERLDYFYGYYGRLLIPADEKFPKVSHRPIGRFLRRELPAGAALEAYRKRLSHSAEYRALLKEAEEAGYAVRVEGKRETAAGGERYMAVVTVRDMAGEVLLSADPAGNFPELAARECFLFYNTRRQSVRECGPGYGMMRAVRRMRRFLPCGQDADVTAF